MPTESNQTDKRTTRRRIAMTVLCLALLLLLLIAPGRNTARLLSAAFDEPDEGDAAFVELDVSGDPGNAGRAKHATVDADDIDDLAAAGDRDHRASAALIDDPAVDVDRTLPGGGVPVLPFGLPTLHSSADGLLNGRTYTSPDGPGPGPVAWGGGGLGAVTPSQNGRSIAGDPNTQPNPGDAHNADGGGDPADNAGGNPSRNAVDNPRIENGGNRGNSGSGRGGPGGPGSGYAGPTGGNTEIVFVPTQDLTGNGDDSGVSGAPGVNGGNLLKPADEGVGGHPNNGGDGQAPPAPVAEPATLTLLGSGMVILSRTLRRRRTGKQ